MGIFNEQKLREEIAKTWGEHGAHIEVYDMLLKKANIVFESCNVSGSLRYSEREIDFAYLAGVFNVLGIDGLQKEIERLKRLSKEPHDIIKACRIENKIELVVEPKRDFVYVCNECNFPNLTSSVSEDEIKKELHACINCGCFEMRKRYCS